MNTSGANNYWHQQDVNQTNKSHLKSKKFDLNENFFELFFFLLIFSIDKSTNNISLW
jgi:hypothetical protein